jgi:DNA polymerase-3 subunit delta'
MSFKEFLGNERIVAALRGMLASHRVPHAMLFGGPRGVGKYTLAVLFAQAANCERMADDACGECAACVSIGQLRNPQPLIERGLEERGASPDAATVERIPLLLQTHPDVSVVVPDPVRLRNPAARPVVRMGQLRAVQRAAYFKPQAKRRVFIIDGADTMRSDYANIFLKVLEEPPETATLILLAPNPYLLLPTIQSRCMRFFFAPVAVEKIEAILKERRELKPAQRKLAAQLAEGSVGAALELDLDESERLRRAVLGIVQIGVQGRWLSALFAATQQLARNEKESFEKLLEMFYSLLTDLLEISHGPKSSALRNPDLRGELEALGTVATLDWVSHAVAQVDQLQARLRRNVNRQLGLDSVALSLSRQPDNSTGPDRRQ